LPFAKEHGVKIATENMWNWDHQKDESCFAACATPDSFCKHIDVVGSEWLVACLDIGHAEMRGSNTSAVQMVKALGSRLQALHIHDNDQWHDSHQIPFSMNIDFVPIVEALKEIDYKGYFTLEADQYLRNYTEENIFDGIKELADSARKLAGMYEG
jgi:sugar phosphate isomerase/epimerase